MPTTKPDPAAVEAARKIAELVDGYAKLRDPNAPEMSQEHCAAIIDSTTRVGELREALAELVRVLRANPQTPAIELLDAVQGAESVLANMNVSDTMLDSRRLRHAHD